MKNEYGLKAPDSFWNMTEEEINSKYAGCGPGRLGDKVIPDKVWGLSIRLA